MRIKGVHLFKAFQKYQMYSKSSTVAPPCYLYIVLFLKDIGEKRECG